MNNIFFEERIKVFSCKPFSKPSPPIFVETVVKRQNCHLKSSYKTLLKESTI